MQKNKHTPIAWGIPAVALAAVLVLLGCPMDPGNGNDHERNIYMTLSGQVYVWVPGAGSDRDAGEWVWDEELGEYTWLVDPDSGSDMGEYKEFDGNRGVLSIDLQGEGLYHSWEGFIGGGWLSFTLGTPPRLRAVGTGFDMLFDGYHYTYTDFTISPGNARGAVLRGLITEGGGFSGWVDRVNLTVDGATSTLDEVSYIYVDRDVTVTGRGYTITQPGFTSTMEDINLRLRAGWNVVHVRAVTTETEDLHSVTTSRSVYDPDWVRWTLWEQEDAARGGNLGLSSRRFMLP